jgi:hypothetical protein
MATLETIEVAGFTNYSSMERRFFSSAIGRTSRFHFRNEELSTKNVGFFPENYVGKEAQRQNVGRFADKMLGLSGRPKFFSICTKIATTGNRTRDPYF